MRVASFLVSLFIISTEMFAVNAQTDYRVDLMNHMFTQPGWLGWYETRLTRYYVEIIDYKTNERQFNINDFLAPIHNGRIVTKDNVVDKIRQAHQFLSCRYVRVLKEICDNQRGIGLACMRMSKPNQSLKCLGNALEMLEKADPLVRRMQGSLWCLHRLCVTPEDLFEKEVFDVLDDLKHYHTSIHFYKESIANGDVMSIVAAHIDSIENQMLLTLNRLTVFYKKFCRPIPPEEEEDAGISADAKNVQTKLEVLPPIYVVYELKILINDAIEPFIKTFDEGFGFKYNLESNTNQNGGKTGCKR
ncbi:uncharacterized protein LOC126837303 [Adelges cooleyi]|uniref:uncharacterized protein LOC126837303 n=1 Tax=Adelges cooleyi TaxID=133065 RepID=UPI0021809206|nr:uncharacterized protein LOC126837303 [Adelges cooleyi]